MPLHNRAGEVILTKFIKILWPLSEKLIVITGNCNCHKKVDNIMIKNIKHDSSKNHLLMRAIKYLLAQVKISYLLFISPKKDVVFLVGTGLILPLLTARIMGIKTVLFAIGSQSNSVRYLPNGSILFLILRLIEKINYLLSNYIIVESLTVANFLKISNLNYKILIGSLYVDVNKFKIIKDFGYRHNIIGYMGRFSEEKGIDNLLEALPLILKKNDISVWIAGAGPLYSKVNKKIKDLENKNVQLYDWVNYSDIPSFLNNLKLLILPSYTEGLPNILLESMACGTPVLATNVGGIPDLIVNNLTGFIMEDNTAECIAKNVIRIVNLESLPNISSNAHEFINKEYTYESAVDRYAKILKNISD